MLVTGVRVSNSLFSFKKTLLNEPTLLAGVPRYDRRFGVNSATELRDENI